MVRMLLFLNGLRLPPRGSGGWLLPVVAAAGAVRTDYVLVWVALAVEPLVALSAVRWERRGQLSGGGGGRAGGLREPLAALAVQEL